MNIDVGLGDSSTTGPRQVHDRSGTQWAEPHDGPERSDIRPRHVTSDVVGSRSICSASPLLPWPLTLSTPGQTFLKGNDILEKINVRPMVVTSLIKRSDLFHIRCLLSTFVFQNYVLGIENWSPVLFNIQK